MPLASINSNTSLYRSLQSAADLPRTERLSSGSRLNSAADDAATVTPSTRVTISGDGMGLLRNDAQQGNLNLNTATNDLQQTQIVNGVSDVESGSTAESALTEGALPSVAGEGNLNLSTNGSDLQQTKSVNGTGDTTDGATVEDTSITDALAGVASFQAQIDAANSVFQQSLANQQALGTMISKVLS